MVAYQWKLVYTKSFYVIADPRVSQLTAKASIRLNTALRPRTRQGYTAKLKTFLAFVTYYRLCPTDLDVILAFLELLAQAGSRAHTLASYISALRHYFQLWDWDCKSLAHRKTQLFIKAVSCNAKYIPRFKATLSISNLTKLATACNYIKHGPVYKAAFMLAFFAFLRVSNVAPPSATSFDPTRHILRSDVIFGSPGAHLIIKWSKSMQAASSHCVVQIPALPTSPICPVAALKALLSYAPASPSSPLFIIPSPSGSSILTAPMLSATLKRLLTALKLNPAHYGFHCFRRSGVSWAVDNGIPIQNLKLHGGWASDAINTYIKETPQASAKIPLTFQKLLL